ncbi:hypothetical protein BayCH28_15595 [Mycolicibacterium sp. CH28]|uniref:hypothetical protein n=1 Tax=Mycolicibacterium sp. CH28 TaxID=2512237 RepID=UPI0010815209|nr:hypothetical protein [Mycolicibacterium sp. CH28]TGD86680.1 hypothetical protein BayCH28_15595 [Mycolicibacterium sp. CH28]
MNTMTKMAAGAVLGGSLLVAGGLGLANAAPSAPASVVGDSKIDIALTVDGQQIGVIQDVSLAGAQTLAGSVCPGDDVSARLAQLDTSQVQNLPACTSATGGLSYTFSQNGPGASDVSPAESHIAPGTAPAATSAAPAPSAAESR